MSLRAHFGYIALSLTCLMAGGCDESRVDKGRYVTFDEVNQAFQQRDQVMAQIMQRLVAGEKKQGEVSNDKKVSK